MDDCNTCICMEDGGGACTRMFCGYSEKWTMKKSLVSDWYT
jgi:hypothetical protein